MEGHEALEALKMGGQIMPNCFKVTLPGVKIILSYQTVIAFFCKGQRYVIKNYWKTTTGKHLNWLDNGDKENRLDAVTFYNKLMEVLSRGEK